MEFGVAILVRKGKLKRELVQGYLGCNKMLAREAENCPTPPCVSLLLEACQTLAKG